MDTAQQYRSKGSTPVKRERLNNLTGKMEVTYTCSKCMSIMVEMKCVHCSKKIKTQEEVDAMSAEMDALVTEYNQLTGKAIKRFASITIGKQRLAQVKFRLDNPEAKPEPKPKKFVRKAARNEKLSDGVRNSWDDEDTAQRRGKRHGAQVNGGEIYKSVWAAFEALKLPLPRVITFRKQLKQKMKADFEYEGKTYAFALVPRPKKEKEAAK